MSTKLFEDEMFEDFKRRSPLDAYKAIDWYTFDMTQLIIELEDGTKILYDNIDKTYRYLKRIYEDEDEENRWKYEFSQRLQKKMQLRAIGQDALSNISGISRPMISRYVSGRSIPSLYNAEKIARALNVSLTELVRFPK